MNISSKYLDVYRNEDPTFQRRVNKKLLSINVISSSSWCQKFSLQASNKTQGVHLRKLELYLTGSDTFSYLFNGNFLGFSKLYALRIYTMVNKMKSICLRLYYL